MKKEKNINNQYPEDFIEDMTAETISDLEFRKHFQEIHLKKYDVAKVQNIQHFVKFENQEGNFFFVRKSSVLWKLNQDIKRISSDRIYRFVTEKNNINTKSNKDFLSIGEYAAFNVEDIIHFGLVLGFQYVSGKRKDYSLQYCPLQPPEECNKNGVKVICASLLLDEYNILSAANRTELKH
jgi:hypothetical protein